MLVQALVTQSAVEAFDKAVLHGLAGRDVVPLDPEGAKNARVRNGRERVAFPSNGSSKGPSVIIGAELARD